MTIIILYIKIYKRNEVRYFCLKWLRFDCLAFNLLDNNDYNDSLYRNIQNKRSKAPLFKSIFGSNDLTRDLEFYCFG